MKKLVFWLISDVIWYVIFTLLSLILFFFYIKSFQLGSGEAGGGTLILLFVFFLINCFFILFQWFHTIYSEKNKQKYLKRKIIIFLIHSILLFFLNLVERFIKIFRNEENAFEWFFYIILFVTMSNFVYYYMVKELGKKLKWGDENN
jgi:hypothetical protein